MADDTYDRISDSSKANDDSWWLGLEGYFARKIQRNRKL